MVSDATANPLYEVEPMSYEEVINDGSIWPESVAKNPNVKKSGLGKVCGCMKNFYVTNQFLILVVLGIGLAAVYPPVGAIYLAPKITATWVAVMFIFLLAGLGLETKEFTNAFKQVKFNGFVFLYSFGVDSAFVFGLSRLLITFDIINKDLADGMVIAACLPVTINMCVVLTEASGGDVGVAIINSSLWNLTGVFLSPVLILGYIGLSGDVSVLKVFTKLAIRVLLPITIGQVLKCNSAPVKDFFKKYKPYVKQAEIYSLVFIVYTVFCITFSYEDNKVPVKDVFLMIVSIGLALATLMVVAWFLLLLFFQKEAKLRITGLYACTHKTVAIGIPLINVIYEGNPAIGLYTLPLLIWHPMQLVIGTFLSPRLLAWVESFDENYAKDTATNATNLISLRGHCRKWIPLIKIVFLSATDLIADWLYYTEVSQITDPDIEKYNHILYIFCIISSVMGYCTIFVVLGQGFCPRNSKNPSIFSSIVRHANTVLGLEVLLEDIPQLALTAIITMKQGAVSPFGMFNFTTSAFNALFNIFDMLSPPPDEDNGGENGDGSGNRRQG